MPESDGNETIFLGGQSIDTAIVESHVRILEEIASTLELEEVLKRIVEAAVHFSGADEGSLLLLDEETGELHMRAAKGFGEDMASTSRQPVSDDNVAGRVMITGQPVLLGPEKQPGDPKVKTGILARSVLSLPIKKGDETYGVLGVYISGGQHTFTHHHLLLLAPLANYAAIAIENARRYRGINRLLGDVYTLFEIVELFTETRDLDELLPLIGSVTLGRIEPADRVVIHLLDPRTNHLERKVRIPPTENESPLGRGFAAGEGIAGQVLLNNRFINVPNVTDHASFIARGDVISGSMLVAPIARRSTCLGTISIASPRENAFGQQAESFLTSLASLAAVAIENARLFEWEKMRGLQLKVVSQLAEKLTSILDLDELLQQSVSLIQETFEYEDVAIKLLDAAAGGLVLEVVVGPHAADFELQNIQPLSEGLAGWSARTGHTALSNDVSEDARYVARELLDTQSQIIIPLKYRGEVTGVLDIQSQFLNAFSLHDILAVEALAAQLAVAIENARLYDQRLRAYEESQDRLEAVERRNRELDSLRDVLGALQSTLSLPEVLSHITNGVVTGLNYRAVMLSTVDEARELLIVREFALEPGSEFHGFLERAQNLTGQQIVGNKASLQQHIENMGIQVCLDQQVRVTHKLHDIFRPVVGKQMSRLIQNMFRLNTFAVLPIGSKERLFGVLYAGTQRSEISEANLEALQAFASQAAVAVKNARQFEDMHMGLRRRVRELQSLQDIDRLISSTSDPEMMLQSILDVGMQLVEAESGNIVLSDKKTGDLIPKAGYPNSVPVEDYEPGLTAWVARERKTARIADLTQTAWAHIPRKIKIRSELAAPILMGEELVGVINMGSSRVNVFTEEDESLLNILATQTAVAIQTARSFQELEKTRLRSFEAERIAAMGDMASNMVHNINNSIGAIRVLVQQIRYKMSKGEETSLPSDFLARKLASIEESAERTLEMARNIRNPFQTLATELVDVNGCIESALARCTIPPRVDLVLDLDYTLPSVMVTQQLEEIFHNLINNALEAMNGLGTLQVSSRRVDESQRAEHAIEVIVADSGPGLPVDLSETSIFNLGVSSKTDGLGFGLWWCKIYLNRVGGNIRLDPDHTPGCKFIVGLPTESEVLSVE